MKGEKMKKAIFLFVLMFVLSAFISAQTPQFYNYNNGTSYNSFPLNAAAGKMIQTLIAPGEFNQPTPITAGNITKFYVRISTGYPLGPATYTSFKLLFSQSTITTLPASLYAGPWDTVYQASSVTFTAAASTWLMITLDHPYTFDPAKSLIVQIEQCAASGTITGYSLQHTTTTVMRRTFSTGGCPFTYGGQSLYVVNCGVDVSSAPTLCNKVAGSFCPQATYPVLPGATYFSAAAWLGDTLYVQAPTSAGAGATTVYRYTFGGTWTTGVPCLTAVAGATLTTCNGKLYLIGGGAAVTTPGNTVQEYNPATGTWTAKSPLPLALAAHGAGCWGDSVIFVYGGPYTPTNLNVYYYRPGTDSWGTITNSFPNVRRTFASAICGNKIVVSCGYSGAAYLNTTYVGTIGSDASQITWAAGPNAYTSLSRPAGASYDKYFFLVGGDTNATAGKNPRISVFNSQTNTWIGDMLNNPNPVSNIMAGVTARCFNDTVRVFQPGGYPASAVGSNIFIVTGCGPTITGSTPISATVPKQYNLSQNYPNPFNPVTKISYDIPKSGFVTIKIYDVIGKEIATLVNETKSAGKYIVDFDGSSFASGTYFYRLETNGFAATKKMMLIK
jgi:hypothetical protein